MATRKGADLTLDPIRLPGITPIPSPDGERTGNGGPRIYIGPRSGFSGANGAPLRTTEELRTPYGTSGPAPVQDYPDDERRSSHQGPVVQTPNLILRVRDVDGASVRLRTMLQDSGTEFSLSRDTGVVRVVAVLRAAEAKRLAAVLREQEGAEVALERLSELKSRVSPTTVVIQLNSAD